MRISAIILCLSFSQWICLAQPQVVDPLGAGFQSPPASARPHIWWHWMNGNVTKAGITADLEAMQRVGIGGAQIFDVGEGIPAGPIKFNSPAWHDMFKFAVSEADRLGLELCLHNCAGWSSSGGPWNTPENSMMHVVNSETNVAGGQKFSGRLPQPPVKWNYYRDLAVFAFPVSDSKMPRLTIKNLDAKDGENGRFVSFSPADFSGVGSAVLKPDDLIDLTSRLDASGHLDWDAPPGNWTVLRIGYTPQGQENHPAPPEGTGPECDKFSPEALDAHWAGFVQKAIDDAGALAGPGKTFNNVLIDSYEVGGQNWSAHFREEFQKRRGYDPLKYLPAFTGRVVDSPEISERFLWDVRRTIADLFAEKYYGHFQELCAAHGMQASIEPYTGPYESLQAGAAAEIPMGEFWVGGGALDPSVKLASSVGHIYGRNIIGAESFTAAPGTHGRWQDDPYALKALGDEVFCTGVNRFIFHRYAMQPWTNRWPGMTMGQWGTHFDRTSTWWEQGRPWLQYVTRSQFLLQQGRFVADAAYFDGENTPVERRDGEHALPPGYDFDDVGADALAEATVEDRELVLKSGMRYHVLILPPGDRTMTPPLLKKISAFAAAGLTVVGPPPASSPSRAGFPSCDQEVKALAAAMWGDCDGTNVTEHVFGRGVVVWGDPLANVFAGLRMSPDFEFNTTNHAQLSYIHRQDGDAEIYFVSNQRDRFEMVDATFRVSGKVPELWHGDTGRMETAPVWREENGRTVVSLPFDPVGSVFVIFRHPAAADHLVAVSASGFLSVTKALPPPSLVIHRAVYDVVPAGKPVRIDVTSKVKRLVAAHDQEIVANNDLVGQDPVENVVKRLHVEFTLNHQFLTNEISEYDTLRLPAGAKITRAFYGDFPLPADQPSQPVDLTSKISGLVENGSLNVPINNHFAGGDPYYGRPKALRVDYSLNGVRRQISVPENQMLSLGHSSAAGEPPPFGLHTDATGRTWLSATAPGRVELTTAMGKSLHAEIRDVPAAEELTGDWDLSFPPNWGAPPWAVFPELMSWTDSPIAGVKYFSGTATYGKQIEISATDLGSGRSLWLDLGRVKNLAEVSLNGQPLGILWKPPFRVEITRAARPGPNKLEVKITNLWPNRLIGDEQLPPDSEWNGKHLKAWPRWLLAGRPSPTGRVTFTTWRHWSKDDSLLESGLLGPVKIIHEASMLAE